MLFKDRSRTGFRRAIAATTASAVWVAAAAVTGWTPPAAAQGMMQLTVPSATYRLGRFRYQPPQADGWRQLANITDSFSMVYAEQLDPEKIETRFGVAMEVHEIPPGTQIAGPDALAHLSKKQMAEARGADLVALSPVEQVASIENLYTYRLLVRSPVEGQPDAYEVYYVAMAPDKTQYVVIQCITKSLEYSNELYFNQFYASLASLEYVPDGASSDKGDKAAAGSDGEGKEGAATETKPDGDAATTPPEN